MKSILSIFLSACLFSTAFAEWVYDSTAKTLTQGTVVLNNVTAAGTKLTIGDNKANETAVELDFSTGFAGGYQLNSIADFAFDSNKYVTKLVLVDTITYIGKSAFFGCENLVGEIVLPDSLTSTGHHPFSQCGISRVVFGAGMKVVNNWFVKECKSLKSIKWHQNITSINEKAFLSCEALTTFENEFPTNVTYVGYSAFHTTPNLEGDNRDLKLLKLTGFGTTAFQNCGIKSIEIGGGLQSTGNAFYHAKKLESVVLHEGVKTISYDCFTDCTALTNLVIASTVTSIANGSMYRMGDAELHVWWKGVLPEGGVSTDRTLITSKYPAVHHFDIANKEGWIAYAATLTNPDVALTIPPKDNSLSEGTWGWKGNQKVVWFGFPAATQIIIW